MTDESAATPPSESGDKIFQLPKDTTPTWEVELLLSGALVFSMLQVPGWLDDWLYAIRPRLSGSYNYGAFMVYFYLKITSYALIGTFVLHLASRAIWVAALGLRSVYPEGVLWDKLPRGPIYRDYTRRTTPTLDQMIDRADNRASLVFAFGLLMVLMSLSIMVFTMLTVVIAGFLGPFLFGSDSTWFTMILVGILFLPMISVTLIDRKFGERIPLTHGFAKAMRGIYWLSGWFAGGRSVNPILLTMFSRLGLVRSNFLIMGVLYSLMAVILIETFARNGVISPPGERYLPQEIQSRELRSINYADARSVSEALEGQPFIPSEIVRGPYLRLFVPYLPRRLDKVIERDCPTAAVTEDLADKAARRVAEAARTAALLNCASSLLHPVLLNGQPIAGFQYDIGKDAQSGLRGFVAMIDVRQLAQGRHELHVARPQRDGDDEPPQPVIVTFWR